MHTSWGSAVEHNGDVGVRRLLWTKENAPETESNENAKTALRQRRPPYGLQKSMVRRLDLISDGDLVGVLIEETRGAYRRLDLISDGDLVGVLIGKTRGAYA